MRVLRLLLVSALITSALSAQANEKVLFNDKQATGFTRVRTDTANVYYMLPPASFRVGHGKGTGVQVTLRDGDRATAEDVYVGFVKVKNDKPDAAGLIGIAQVKAFGTGTGVGTLTYRYTFSTPFDLPERSATFAILPVARSASDVLELRYQDGKNVKLPAGVQPRQMTYHFTGTTVEKNLSPGSVVDLGGIYEEPIIGFFNRSTAYGASDDLYGPESLQFDTKRGDALGYFLRSGPQFKNQVAIIGISTTRSPVPVKTPYGPVLLGAATFQILPLPVVLDANGDAKTLTVPIPKDLQVSFWAQGVFLDFIKLTLKTSDAAQVRTY